MSRRSPIPQRPHHILVYDEDWEFLLTYMKGKMGPSEAIRQITHQWCIRVRAKMEQRVDSINALEPLQ